MKQRKWYMNLKTGLAKLFLKWSLKLDPRYDIHWPIGIFPQMIGYKRPIHLKRMARSSVSEILLRRDIDLKTIKADLGRCAIDELMQDIVRGGFVYVHIEQDNISGDLYAVAEIDVLEIGKQNNYVDNSDWYNE